MGISLRAITLIVALTQGATPVRPIHIGQNAGSRSNEDIGEFEKIAGAKPWLINSPRGQIGDVVELYLQPDKTTKEVRRGTVVVFVFGKVFARNRYAQVILEGRAFDDVKNDTDANRPFTVADDTSIADAELASIVRFIRSRPISPITNFIGRSGAVHGDQPVFSIERVSQPRTNEKLGQIRVEIRESDSSGQRVLLEKNGDSWVVVSALEWIA